MFKNYFKSAWRNLAKNKVYSLINIGGLTFGITSFLLIGLYLFDELTFDRQHSKADRIYRLVEHRHTKGEELHIAAGSYALAEESKKNIPEIENTARFSRTGYAGLRNPDNQILFNQAVTVGNPGFFEIFDFEFIEGDKRTALLNPNSIILVEDLALKLFGTTKAVGKTARFSFMNDPLTVTAVIKAQPLNSSFSFTSLISESSFTHNEQARMRNAKDWNSLGYTVFVLLKENTKPAVVSEKLRALTYSNFKPEPGTSMAFSLQPLKDMHLHSEGIVDGARNSNVEPMASGQSLYIYLFSIIALFVLLIACINYMNLTTARAANRSKEIGVRKVVGASRKHIIAQFFIESIIIAVIAFIFSLVLVNVLLIPFNQFANKTLSLGLQTDHRIWIMALTALLVTTVLSGSYPALLLSQFRPVLLLKKMRLKSAKGISLRKGLVVFQFTISIVMIAMTMVLVLQMRYTNQKDLGFNKDQLVVVDVNSGKVRRESMAIKQEFLKIPGVRSVSVTSRVPGEWKSIYSIKIKNSESIEEPKTSYLIGVDESFPATFETKILKGRSFSDAGDSASVILNEAAAKLLNITEAASQIVEIPSRAYDGDLYTPLNDSSRPFFAHVIGIMKDFNFQSLREEIAPMVLAYRNNPVQQIDYFTAKIDGRDSKRIISSLDQAMTKIDSRNLFEYHFLDERLSLFYAEDRRRETILIWIALATIFIACLGLFGLATYAAEQRVKEIGVRKVLGASVTRLTTLLSGGFVKLVALSFVIATPIAWWAADRWLNEFAYHIEPSWWIFGTSGIFALLIALLTVSYQAIKAAIANPVKSLRAE